jgi:hypothetical protein
MRERILAQEPADPHARERLAYTLRAVALLERKTGDAVAALRDYLRAHTIYSDLRARAYGGAYVAAELGITELELGELAAEGGRRAEACEWYRKSAAVYGEQVAQGALLSDSHEQAEMAKAAAAACAR